MNKHIKAYLFEGKYVVTDKSVIVNSKDEHYEEIELILSAEEINRYHQELEEINEIGARGQ